jgi:membrane protease YdiL (CAAX protease family)
MDDLKSSVSLQAENPPPPPDLNAPSERPLVYSVFWGPHGLRAGWRLLAYYILFRCFARGGGLLVGWLVAENLGALRQITLSELITAVSALAAGLVMASTERRPFGTYGLPGRRAFGKLYWAGALWGLASITVLLLAMRGAHVFEFGHVMLHGARVVKFAVFWGGFFLLVAVYEEFYFRGYFQFTLTDALKFLDELRPHSAAQGAVGDQCNFWLAAVILSACFGWVHLGNSGENWVGGLGAGCIGLFLCLTLRRTGNLWFAIGFHSSFDWGETYLYSVPNSGTSWPGHLLSSSLHGPAWLAGGSVGPEASIFVFVLVAILWVIFDRVYPQVNYRV